jgi:hypothetical protein
MILKNQVTRWNVDTLELLPWSEVALDPGSLAIRLETALPEGLQDVRSEVHGRTAAKDAPEIAVEGLGRRVANDGDV